MGRGRAGQCRWRVQHAGTVEDLQGVLFLGKEQATRSGGDVDAEEVVERAEVGHGEFAVKSLDDGVEHRARAGGEDDVVDVEEQVGKVITPSEDEERGV